jgi:septal ring factor EnvC (AmiA/AmiB activator)
MKHSAQLRAGGFPLFLVLFWMLLLASGCTKGPMPVCHPNYYHALESKAIAQEIGRLKARIEEAPENQGKSESYFYLALLYAHYNNPAPDYSLSLDMFAKYLAINPDSSKKDEVLYLKTLLQGLVETNKGLVKTNKGLAETNKKLALSQKEVKRLKQQAGKVNEKNKELVLENQNLKEALEKLKLLDLQLEEKRLKY